MVAKQQNACSQKRSKHSETLRNLYLNYTFVLLSIITLHVYSVEILLLKGKKYDTVRLRTDLANTL